MNTIKTIVLLGFLSCMIVTIGYVLGGREGMMFAFVIAVVTNIGSYWFSAPLALRMNGAVPVSREEAPELYQIVENIAARAKVPVPSIHIIPSDSPNAFATGRNPENAAVAVTEGLLRILNWDELDAVIAHEMGHVRNRDILIASIAAVLASTITMVAHFGMYLGSSSSDRRSANPIFAVLVAMVAPLAAAIVQCAISRSRELEADATGAELSGNPIALANALLKIEEIASQRPLHANPAMASLYIMKPDSQSLMVKLFSTHPPTEERVKRLQEIANRKYTHSLR